VRAKRDAATKQQFDVLNFLIADGGIALRGTYKSQHTAFSQHLHSL
jgi:hypothetical protein